MSSDTRRPLYVRLPEPEAERLDRASFERKRSKQDLISDLVAQHLGTDGLTLGRHALHPAPAPAAPTQEVLTAEEAAELLRTTEGAVVELAEAGELPGRRIGGAWRFARAAVLAWLARA